MSRMMERKQLERQAKRILVKAKADLSDFQMVWVCKAYAQAKLSGAEDVADVDLCCDYAGEGEDGDQAVIVATCELLGIEIPADWEG